MSGDRKCRICKTPLPAEQPDGPCPSCALVDALALSSQAVWLDESSSQRIGPYQLIGTIGEGGYGTVYRAEQVEPIRRTVALKLIKLGMNTRQVIARFEAERQALALMDHPNIARVFDAGTTETGRPYFVMELVEGIKITDYCSQEQLATRDRLNLFIQVCRAIQHAHQKGIVHRDLKPSNILVAVVDGKPTPKVIDFGIAKAIQGRLSEETQLTAENQFLGTPAYMSPEQAALGELDVDTRSDIYALGVLLYELLTGRTPFEKHELRRAGLDEMRRVIREENPPKPSTKLGNLTPPELAATALLHRAGPPQFLSGIRGDLDWIVMKCLEKDRTRRYDTASGLGRDVEFFLNDEPVTAAAPSAGYRARKFVRRHRLGLGVALGLSIVLIVGTAVSTWQAVRATRAEREEARLRGIAEAAEKTSKADAAKSSQVARFLKDMLNGVGPSVALGRDTTMLREILTKTEKRVETDLKNQPDVEADLRNTLGNVYEELGDYEKAGSLIRGGLAVRTNLYGAKHLLVADSLNDLGAVLVDQGKPADAEALFRKALAIQVDLLGQEDPIVANSFNNLGSVLLSQSQLTNAAEMHRKALEIRRKKYGNEHADVASSLHNMGNVLLTDGKLAEAEANYREAAAIRRKLLGTPHPLLATTLGNLGTVLWYEGKLADAEVAYLETLAMQRLLLGQEHKNVATSIHNLGCLQLSQGKLGEADKSLREALAMRRKVLGNDHPDVAGTLTSLGAAVLSEGGFAEAESLQREALAIQEKRLGLGHQDVAISNNNLADILRLEGKLSEAESIQRGAVSMLKRLLGEEHQLVATALDVLGNVFKDANNLPEAAKIQRQTLAMRKKLLTDEHPDVAQSLNNLASVLDLAGQFDEAEAMYRQALVLRRKLIGNDHPDVAETLEGLAVVLQQRAKLGEAEELMRECLQIYGSKLPDDWRHFGAQARLGEVLLAEGKTNEAEKLMVTGVNGLKMRADTIPANCKGRLSTTVQKIVQLYETQGQFDRAAEWRKRL